DVKDALLVRNLRNRLRERRVHVSDEKIDLVALDQLASLLHGGARITARRIFREQIDLAAKDAALGVDLIDRKLAPDLLVLAGRGVSAGQRIVETDLDIVRG